MGTSANLGGLGGAIQTIGGAIGSLFETQGNAAEAQSYTQAAVLEGQNAQLTEAATRIQETQTARTVAQSLGTTQADVAGAGFTESGSALDIIRSSAQQGALATALVNVQGAINENAYAAEEGKYYAQAKAANEAGTANTVGAIANIASGALGLISGASSIYSGLTSGTGVLGTIGSALGLGGTVAGAVGAAGLAAETAGTTAAAGVGTSAAASAGSAAAELAAASGAESAADVGFDAADTAFLADATASSAIDSTIAGATAAASGADAGSLLALAAVNPLLLLGAVAATAVLGSIVGGLFGPGSSDETQIGEINVNNGTVNTAGENSYSDTGSKYSASNASLRNSLQQGGSNFAQFLLANGATEKTPQATTDTSISAGASPGTTPVNGIVSAPGAIGEIIAKDSPVNTAASQFVVKVGSRDGIQFGVAVVGGLAPDYTVTLSSGATSQSAITALNQVILSQYNIPASLQAQLQTMNLANFYTTGATPSGQPVAD
jgi:hypothetical protein